jgi:hypothetical protein
MKRIVEEDELERLRTSWMQAMMPGYHAYLLTETRDRRKMSFARWCKLFGLDISGGQRLDKEEAARERAAALENALKAARAFGIEKLPLRVRRREAGVEKRDEHG